MKMLKKILLWSMGVFYVFAGIMHFVATDFYMPMMPPYLPLHLELIYLSGIAEIALGVGVMLPAYRKVAAWGIIALLIAVFPANLHIALNNIPIGGASEGLGAANYIRLPVQGLLILWAWWYTRE